LIAHETTNYKPY